MNHRHFGIEDESSTDFFKLSINGRLEFSAGGEGVDSWALTCMCHYYGLRSSCSKRRGAFDVSCVEAFARLLLADLE